MEKGEFSGVRLAASGRRGPGVEEGEGGWNWSSSGKVATPRSVRDLKPIGEEVPRRTLAGKGKGECRGKGVYA